MQGTTNADVLQMSLDAENALKSANEAFLSADKALERATPTPPGGLKYKAQRKWRRAYLMSNLREVARLDKVAVKNVGRLGGACSGVQNLPQGVCSGVQGKGGIIAPPGLSKKDQKAWRLAHNKRWRNMTHEERARLQQQQSEEPRSNSRTTGLDTAQHHRPRVAEADGMQTHQIEELGKIETRKRAHSPTDMAPKIGDDDWEEDVKYDPATLTIQITKKRRVDDTAPSMAKDTTDLQLRRPPETKVPVDEAMEVPDASEFVDETQHDRVINVNSDTDFMKYVVDYDGHPATHLDFGPLFKLSDTHVEEILRKGPVFTDNVIQITAGNPELRQPLTDMGLIHLVAACPRLEYLSIHGGSNITDDSLSVVLEHCPFIRHIALCGADFEPNNMCGWPLLELIRGPPATLLDKIAVMNTAIDTETVRKLRDLRPGLRISARG